MEYKTQTLLEKAKDIEGEIGELEKSLLNSKTLLEKPIKTITYGNDCPCPEPLSAALYVVFSPIE
ncbi:MAG TPA: hypothetical protein VJB94_04555 [Candidatus Nanoarchaeia archaeon]|nr:hypothetical protein [Candidatus Nanoarchaeia archaeon]